MSCNHKDNEDCLICSACGECSESLNDFEICSACEEEETRRDEKRGTYPDKWDDCN